MGTVSKANDVTTRKLQVVGGSTYAVTLPKAWVERLGLSSGDEIRLQHRAGGELLLQTVRDPEPPRHEWLVHTGTRDPDRLLRVLTGLYVAGVRLIRLRLAEGSGSQLRRAVAEACDRLKGLQLIEEGDDEFVLQDIEDPHELDMTRSLRMMHHHAQHMLSDAASLLRTTATLKERSWELERCEAELDRLLLLLVKHHNVQLRDLSYGRGGGFAPEESLYVVLAAQYLERIGDYAERIAQAATQLPTGEVDTLPTEFPERLVEAASILDRAFEAFMDGSESEANAATEDAIVFAKRVRQAGPELLGAAQPEADEAGLWANFTIVEAIERVALYAKSLAEFSIDKALAVHEDDGTHAGITPGDRTRVHRLAPDAGKTT